MKPVLFVFLLIHSIAAARKEFGRNAVRKLSAVPQFRAEEQELHDFVSLEEFRALFESNDVGFSLSLSMSYAPSPRPPVRPTPSTPLAPNPSPVSGPTSSTLAPTLTSSYAPSASPAPTAGTTSPKPTPSQTAAPSSSTATAAPLSSTTVYECTDQGVEVTQDPANVTTPLSVSLAYAAEASTNNTNDFLDDLEGTLLSWALAAALECQVVRRRDLKHRSSSHHKRQLGATTTDVLGNTCTLTSPNATDCFLLETSLAFVLNKDVDPDYASFLVYSGIQSAMANYTAGEIDFVEKLSYIAPLPRNTTQEESVTPDDGKSGFKVSPWAIGACVAMSTGGIMAFVVWFHNRRTRHKRHVELVDVEQNSLSPVSLFSAERDVDTQA